MNPELRHPLSEKSQYHVWEVEQNLVTPELKQPVSGECQNLFRKVGQKFKPADRDSVVNPGLKQAKVYPVTKCSICEKDFLTVRSLEIHARSGHTFYNCEFCEEKFIKKFNLKYHIVKNHPVSKCSSAFHKCEYCDEKFTSKTELNNHRKNNLASKCSHRFYKCESCHEEFTSKTKFYDHIRKNHPVSKCIYKCESCDENFTSKTKLNDHIRKNLCFGRNEMEEIRTKNYKCQYCDFDCLQHIILAKHMAAVHDMQVGCGVSNSWVQNTIRLCQ